MWFCPACQHVLEKKDGNWCCENGHSFDIGKEGYVNLLLAQHKKSKEPGDNKQMINARRSFLEKGYYNPLAHRLGELIVQHISKAEPEVFDAGCGEGYYLKEIRAKLTQAGRQPVTSGCDISKIAVQKAAKKYTHSEFCVASTFNIPLGDASQDAVVQVFAPSSEQEVHRILNDNGIWLQVDPAAEHLHQLKAAIYQETQTHKEKSSELPGFELLEQQELGFDFDLREPEDTVNLLMMTPYYWSASEESKEAMKKNVNTVGARFQIRVFGKAKGAHA